MCVDMKKFLGLALIYYPTLSQVSGAASLRPMGLQFFFHFLYFCNMTFVNVEKNIELP